MRAALIDDNALLAVLSDERPPALRRRTLATTGHWYVRLCQAALRSDGFEGSLSAPLSHLPEPFRSRTFASVMHLPEEIALPSLRELGPVIGRLRPAHRLNVLSMEVLAAAEHLDADVFLSVPSPKLQVALHEEGRRYKLLTEI